MNKVFINIFLFIIAFNPVFSQNAIDYFPQSATGVWWTFDVYNLDSNSVRIDESKRTKLDSLLNLGNYYGEESYAIASKVAPPGLINSAEFIDTTFINFDGPIAQEYFGFFVPADSGDAIDSLIYDFISSIRDWYPLFQFDSPVNEEYLLLDRDTVITVVINDEPLDVTLNLSVNGQRTDDADNIETGVGNFDGVKVFVYNLKFKLIIPLLPPPLPPIELDVVTIPDTLWIATEHWVIKEYRPTVTTQELDLFGIPSFYIFGEEKYLADFDMLVGVNETFADNLGYELKQNYPNPFSKGSRGTSSTTIEFTIPKNDDVKLSVYNLLGERVAVLLNERLSPGDYKINFNAMNLSAGIYFYELRTNKFNIVKRMILLK